MPDLLDDLRLYAGWLDSTQPAVTGHEARARTENQSDTAPHTDGSVDPRLVSLPRDYQPGDGASRRRWLLPALAAIVAAVALVAGLVAVEGGDQDSVDTGNLPSETTQPAVAVTESRPLSSIPPEWDQESAPLMRAWRECLDQVPRPDDPELAAQWDEDWGTGAGIKATQEEALRIGWMPTMSYSMTKNESVCGWTIYDEGGIDWSDSPDLADKVAGRQALYDLPNGHVMGYAWQPEAYVSVEELADPDFDLEATMIEKFGHCVSLRGNVCPENPLAE